MPVKNYRLTAVIMALCLLAAVFVLKSIVSDAADELAPDPDNRSVLILMYHSILPDPDRQGEYVLSPSALESDMLRLREAGYETVFVSDLIAFCEGKGELPEKPVILTFDDGQLNNLTYVLPLLVKHDMCASFSAVGRFAEAASEEAERSDLWSYMDFYDLTALLQSGRAELVNHTYDMHSLGERRGVLQLSTESFREYRRAFFNDVLGAQRLFKESLGVTPLCFAYPYGFSCEAARALVKVCGFKATLGTEGRSNLIRRRESEDLYSLGRYNRPAGETSEQFLKRIGAI